MLGELMGAIGHGPEPASWAAIRAVVWSAGIRGAMWPIAAHVNEGGQAVSAEQVRRATLRAG